MADESHQPEANEMSENEDQADAPLLESVSDAMLWHAERCWQAEQENARRIMERVRLLTAGIVALLGLGLFKIQWSVPNGHMSAVKPSWLEWIVRGSLVVAVLLLSWALYTLLRRTENSTSNAASAYESSSYELALHDEDEGIPDSVVTFRRTYNAYTDLQSRNVSLLVKLKNGEEWFARGFVVLLLSLCLYIVGSGFAIMANERMHDHGNTQAQSIKQAGPENRGSSARNGQQSNDHSPDGG